MAAQQAKQILKIRPTEKDDVLLHQCFTAINGERFANQVKINARWDYPSAVEPRDPAGELDLLPTHEQAQVARAIQAYAERDWKLAKRLLHPFSNYELRQVKQLYISTLRHLKEPIWFPTSQQIWQADPETVAPAVASIEIVNEVEEILVSPALSSIGYKAPKFVVSYVVFHEMMHKVLDTKAYNPHPRLFRRMEATAYRRDCAVAWLRKHRFSTIEDLV